MLFQTFSVPFILPGFQDFDDLLFVVPHDLKEAKIYSLPSQQSNDHSEVLAAHERTDVEVTDEMRKHDQDIMMNDSEWE